MMGLIDLDWSRMFVPSQPILETVIRGTAVYLTLFFLLRMFRRQAGSIGPADLLVLLLLADASQNAMAGNYSSITDGILLVVVIMAWEYCLDWAAYRIPVLGRLIDRPALPIVENGQVNRQHLEQEFMTEDELLSQLRQKGVEDFARVKCCYIEGDGAISVITRDAPPTQSAEKRDPSTGL